MKNIQKKIEFEIESVKYQIQFPNVGQYLDIENMKMMLTNNSYADLLRSNLKTAYFAVDLVDAISIFYVLVPELKNDLNVRSYNELDSFLAKKIIASYKKYVKVWYDQLLEELMKDDEIPTPEDFDDDENHETISE